MITEAFLYKWTELSTSKWYIGSRTEKGCHQNDEYVCSSKTVKPLIIANPDNWRREILATGAPKCIRLFEIQLLKMLDAKRDSMSYNQSNTMAPYWSVSGKLNPNLGTKYGPRPLGWIHPSKGMKRGISPFKGIPSGRKGIPSPNKGIKRGPKPVDWTNPRKGIKRGTMPTGWINPQKGIKRGTSPRKGTKWPQKKVQCPYCLKEGGIGNIKRYHFENCKYKIVNKFNQKTCIRV